MAIPLMNRILCKKCEGKINCEYSFRTGVFCQFIKTDSDKSFAKLLSEFCDALKVTQKTIWLKEFELFKANQFPSVEEIIKKNKNKTAMLKILAQYDLNHKFAQAEDTSDLHYSEARKYYEKLFGNEVGERFTITIVNGNETFVL